MMDVDVEPWPNTQQELDMWADVMGRQGVLAEQQIVLNDRPLVGHFCTTC